MKRLKKDEKKKKAQGKDPNERKRKHEEKQIIEDSKQFKEDTCKRR